MDRKDWNKAEGLKGDQLNLPKEVSYKNIKHLESNNSESY